MKISLRDRQKFQTYCCPQRDFGSKCTCRHIQCYLRQSSITEHEKSHDCDASIYQNTQNKTVQKEMSREIRDSQRTHWYLVTGTEKLGIKPYYQCFCILFFVGHRLVYIWKDRMSCKAKPVDTDRKRNATPIHHLTSMMESNSCPDREHTNDNQYCRYNPSNWRSQLKLSNENMAGKL
jgi:hypothetical protein